MTSHLPNNRSAFAFLRLGKTRLLLPRADVRILELTLDVDTQQTPPPHGVGWISIPGHAPCPVFCCSDTLEWSPTTRHDLPVCAVLTLGQGHHDGRGQDFAILCSEMVMADHNRLLFSPVPPAMHTASQPFDQLATDGTEVFCVTSAQRLWLDLMPKESP